MSIEREPGSGDHIFGVKSSIPLQVTRWTEQRVGQAVNGVSALVVIPAGASLIEITSTENCFLNFGDNTVVATTTIASDDSRLFLAGVQVVPVPTVGGVPLTHVAVIRESVDGTLQIEEVN